MLRRGALALFGLLALLDLVFVVCWRAVEGYPGLAHPEARLELGEVFGILLVGTTGLTLTWLRPRNPVGWLVSCSGLALALCDAGQAYGMRALLVDQSLPAGGWVTALSAGLWIPSLLIVPTVLLVRYPSGHIDGRWPRRFSSLAVVGFLGVHLAYSASDPSVGDVVRGGESPLDLATPVVNTIGAVSGVALVLALLLIVADAIRRVIRSGAAERKALLLVLGTSVAVLLIAFVDHSPEWFLSVAWMGVIVAITVGVLKYGALGIEITVLSGDRNDPFAALNRLGAPMGDALDERTLPGVLAAVVEALGVSGVAVDGPIVASAGVLPDKPMELPLTFGGTDLGRLLVGTRPGRDRPNSTDRRVAEAVAPLVAAVLHSVRVAEELKGHQERIVAATQAERGRLRQELHDGLGPSLTGIGLGLEALAPTVPGSSEDLVARLREEVTASLEETRRIIDDLRPTALDDDDLPTALRKRAAQVSGATGLEVTVEVPDSAPIPQAAAVAAYRIAEEALTNVVRHAGATTCTIRLTLDDGLRLEVTDDGAGPGPSREGGVGLASMRTRAERLGGTFSMRALDPGTQVLVALPLEDR